MVQSIQAAAPSNRKLPDSVCIQSEAVNRSSCLRAKARQTSCWPDVRTFAQNAPASRIFGQSGRLPVRQKGNQWGIQRDRGECAHHHANRIAAGLVRGNEGDPGRVLTQNIAKERRIVDWLAVGRAAPRAMAILESAVGGCPSTPDGVVDRTAHK